MKIEGVYRLFGFAGFIIDKITFSPEIVHISMHRDGRRRMPCPDCNRSMTANKKVTRAVHDLPIGTALGLAVESELRPLIRFGMGVCRDQRELLNVLQFGFTNAAMERFNGTVAKVIARGHGYKDQRYLFLKLRQQAIKNTITTPAILR